MCTVFTVNRIQDFLTWKYYSNSVHSECHTGFLKGGQFAWVVPVANKQQELVHLLKHVEVDDVRDLASAQRQHQFMSEVNISTYREGIANFFYSFIGPVGMMGK